MKRLLVALLVFISLFLVSCAPSAGGKAAGLARFPIKIGEKWSLAAFKPGSTAAQVFPLELYDEPEADEDGIFSAAAEAGKFESEVYYNPDDQLLLVFVLLTRGTDPEIVFCIFGEAQAGRAPFQGRSFYGRSSELKNLDSLPRQRFSDCDLSKK
jgi:hypothetical protein